MDTEQKLHQIWNGALHDDAVPAAALIMEAMRRAFDAGMEWQQELNSYEF